MSNPVATVSVPPARAGLSIQSILLIMLLLVSMLSSVVIGAIGFINGRESLRDAAFASLTEVRDSRAREVSGLFSTIENTLLLESSGESVTGALTDFDAAYSELEASELTPEQADAVDAWYKDVFATELSEATGETVLLRPRVVPRLRRNLVRVDPVRDHDNPARRGTLGDEPPTHRLADRDDAIRTAKIRADDPAENADSHRVREAPKLHRRLGEHVLADDDERDAESAGQRETDGADHRRVCHAENDVRRPGDEAAAEGTAEVGEVVGGPCGEPCAVVRRRADMPDRNAVPLEHAGIVLVLMHHAGENVDVTSAREAFTELGEQVRGRLDARPVVLVEHEEALTGARSRRHPPRLTSIP